MMFQSHVAGNRTRNKHFTFEKSNNATKTSHTQQKPTAATKIRHEDDHYIKYQKGRVLETDPYTKDPTVSNQSYLCTHIDCKIAGSLNPLNAKKYTGPGTPEQKGHNYHLIRNENEASYQEAPIRQNRELKIQQKTLYFPTR